nr:RNA-directed DNA polymerase, eukaryota [Tanacetum cinerariifolium]
VLGVGVPLDIVRQGALRIGMVISRSRWFFVFPRLFALELDKDISVAAKWSAPSFDVSFRRQVRDGVERNPWSALLHMLCTITLSSSSDRYFCDLNGDGAYRVKDIRSELDDLFLPSSAVATRWVNLVPIKVNIFAWHVSLDRLPTRGKSISQRICRWWNIQWEEVSSFVDWFTWFGSIRLPSKLKAMLEGVLYSAWWHVWSFQNSTMTTPRPTPFPATIPRARVFTLFVIISNSDNEITTLPVRPAPPSPDHTPALYGYPLDSGDDSSDEDLSETAKSLHTQIVSTSVVHPPPT